MKKLLWLAWGVCSVMVAGYLGYKMTLDEDKAALLIGDASHGHFQIEMACESCHTDPFGGKEVLQGACVNCHQKELDDAHDSHPKKTFNDPRNADLLKIIDARYCISCHTEHQNEQTHDMGVTVAGDYCYYCHENVGDERPSHEGLAFDSCASAGCHNYHDNKALYESFLVEKSGGQWLKEVSRITKANSAAELVFEPVSPDENRATLITEKTKDHPDIFTHALAITHNKAGMDCGSCHLPPALGASDVSQQSWIDQPGVTECSVCHQKESDGFLASKHGVKLAQGLSAQVGTMVSEHSKLTFSDASQDTLHGCSTCHSSDVFAPSASGTDACLSCHVDEHSTNFEHSPHANIEENLKGSVHSASSEVTCATCHLPRLKEKKKGSDVVYVEHNQNLTLRPNEKMIRTVCMECHNLSFSIDALADESLIKSNFTGKPKAHVPSIDWALERTKEKE